ncbi:hypothetical protein THTE_1976 [Thermogutta terrifontis]|uniref:Uncharacterized protein n=1 Tax=Thermogutta terrifontis TaxID=1331910 RepID=A0A286RF48_9BACT|nr:hypothetical protein THTE_1976 [Thermogutta terrifontis]
MANSAGKRNNLQRVRQRGFDTCFASPGGKVPDSQKTAGLRQRGRKNVGFFVQADTMTIREGVPMPYR